MRSFIHRVTKKKRKVGRGTRDSYQSLLYVEELLLCVCACWRYDYRLHFKFPVRIPWNFLFESTINVIINVGNQPVPLQRWFFSLCWRGPDFVFYLHPERSQALYSIMATVSPVWTFLHAPVGKTQPDVSAVVCRSWNVSPWPSTVLSLELI